MKSLLPRALKATYKLLESFFMYTSVSCSALVLYEGEISKGKSYTSASDHSASSTIPSNFISVKQKNELNDKRNNL